MESNKIDIAILFPYLRNLPKIKIGNIEFKNSFESFSKEPLEVQHELQRIVGFFRQAEGRPIDHFSYSLHSIEKADVNKLITSVKSDLEVFRFCLFEPGRTSLSYEQTTPYLILSDQQNPFTFDDGKKHYIYRAFENLDKGDKHLSHYEGHSNRPAFNLNVYTDDTYNFNEKNYINLVSKVEVRDIRALVWYNKTYSSAIVEQTENLLRVSTAFETLLGSSERKGTDRTLDKLNCEILLNDVTELTPEQQGIVKKFLFPSITEQLAQQVKRYSGSDKLKDWFKKYLYPVGSAVRHGDEVELLPMPRQKLNSRNKSIWYGMGASHDFLNNIYFGKKLFKFVFLEKHYPSTKFVKQFEVEALEQQLTSDEERLQTLETELSNTEVGEATLEQLKLCLNLGGSYSGDKLRVYTLLQRMLQELKTSFPAVWKEIVKEATDQLFEGDMTLEKLQDYEGFKPYFHALIEVDSTLSGDNTVYAEEKDFKLFCIKQFVSFSVHHLI